MAVAAAITASGAVVFHHQASAAPRYVRDYGRAAVQLGDYSEADRESEFHGLALAQAHVAGFDEDAGRTQVACAA
jgi:hypothetical protein